MAEKGAAKKEKHTKRTLILICLAAAIVITALEGMGHDPLAWLGKKLGGVSEICDDELCVHFIDVGQGDCVFITAGGVNMLIDCGEASESDKVISYLNNEKVKKLDYIIATHPHSDHMGGMSSIIDTYDIGEIIMPHLPDEDIPNTRYFEKFLDSCDAENLGISEAEVGHIIKIGEARAEIIAPLSDAYDGANNYSVSVMLTHGSNDFLFTGDAEKSAENEMLENGKLNHVRVFKAGHHGSDTSNTKNFLEAVSPEYAVIMCGAENSYGHPHDEAVKRLGKYTKRIYRTDLNGSIVFKSDGFNLQIRAEREN